MGNRDIIVIGGSSGATAAAGIRTHMLCTVKQGN